MEVSNDRGSEGTYKIAEMVRCTRDPEGNMVLNAGKPVISVCYVISKL